jgi:hypothetical protein
MRFVILFAVILFVGLLVAAGLAHAGALPDPKLTPGVADPAVTQANIDQTICVPGYTARVRHVTLATKRKVFAEYGVDPKVGGPYEDDHLISLELGGSNDIRNQWPQSYTTKPWNAHVKDALENRLHALVCAHALPLADAQHAIVTDWTKVYVRYFGEPVTN